MKKTSIIFVATLMLGMSSCLVSSLNPFYKAEDRYYTRELEGSWLDSDSCLWIIEANMKPEAFMGEEKHDGTYRVTYDEEGKKAILTGTLFRLDGIDYVDFTPAEDEDHCINDLACWHHIPVHTLARVRQDGDSLMLYWYGDDWLNALFEEKRIRIQHQKLQGLSYDRHILTAGTDELQKFIRKFVNDEETEAMVQGVFAKGDTDDQEDSGVFLKMKRIKDGVPAI